MLDDHRAGDCSRSDCGLWQVSDETLSIARAENEAAIRRLVVAREEDRWPTGYEEVRVLDIA